MAKKLAAAGVVAAKGFRNRGRSVKKRILQIVKLAARRTDQAKEEVKKTVGELVGIGQKVVTKAREIIGGAMEAVKATTEPVKEKVAQGLEKWNEATTVLEKVLGQAQQVLAGTISIPNRLVSVHDLDARPISKGKVGKPTEFGFKVQIEEAEGGLVTGYAVEVGNPADVTLLKPAVERHKARFKRTPAEVAAD